MINDIEDMWISEEGYKCFIKRIGYSDDDNLHHRCGYVKVPENHITNGLNYGDIPINIHGGLTYSKGGVFGFDCAHLGDTKEEWNLEAVKKETNNLSKQLSKLTWKNIINYKLASMPNWFSERVTISKRAR